MLLLSNNLVLLDVIIVTCCFFLWIELLVTTLRASLVYNRLKVSVYVADQMLEGVLLHCKGEVIHDALSYSQ